ncbi:NusG domain II-containing protein [Niallia sp. Krafla_26]|uniref:NusG domain II-containing protein n=1 Tax=Niallia sp. Krafla_26 TaxID=3064703 RepID=UPI003D171F56
MNYKEMNHLKNALQMIKRWDIIITVLFLALSFIPVSIFSYQQAKVEARIDNLEYVAVISSRNKEVKRYTLTGHKSTEKLNIPEIECNPDTVEVRDEEIRIESSTCPEQICVNTGYISKPGPAIICLPHQVIISVEAVGGEENADQIIISS